jgi:hypothetical protein
MCNCCIALGPRPSADQLGEVAATHQEDRRLTTRSLPAPIVFRTVVTFSMTCFTCAEKSVGGSGRLDLAGLNVGKRVFFENNPNRPPTPFG